MKFTIPFLGALSEATGTIIEKKVLRKKRVDFRAYNTFSFLAIILMLIPLLFILNFIFPEKFPITINSEAFILKNIIILLGVIFFSILANLFVFYAMKWEKMTEIEPMRLMQPLFTIILAFIFYTGERQTQTQILIAALIASLTLILSHVHKYHFQLNKYAWSAIFGSLFFAIELVISKQILTYYPPLIFYLFRCLGVFLVSLFIFKSNAKKIEIKTWSMIYITGLIWIVYRLLLYTSFVKSGLIITTLLFILTPVFIYILSYKYLNEKPNWRNIIASVIIVLCVAYAMIISN